MRGARAKHEMAGSWCTGTGGDAPAAQLSQLQQSVHSFIRMAKAQGGMTAGQAVWSRRACNHGAKGEV